MDDILKITKDTISNMFSFIKKGIEETAKNYADSKDETIIAAALIGKHVEKISLLNINYISRLRRDKGTFMAIYRGSSTAFLYGYYYFYSKTSAPIPLTADNLTEILIHFDSYNGSYPMEYLQDEWSTNTPIVDSNKQISSIYKGETVGGFTKWIIMFNTGNGCETEDQSYTAYKKSNTGYTYGTYEYRYENFNKPWELWLPSDAAVGSVVIDI